MATRAILEELFVAQVTATADPPEVLSVTFDFAEGNANSWTELTGGGLVPGDAYRITIANYGATGIRVGPKSGNPGKFPFEISSNSAADFDHNLRADDGLTIVTAEDAAELLINVMIAKLVS